MDARDTFYNDDLEGRSIFTIVGNIGYVWSIMCGCSTTHWATEIPEPFFLVSYSSKDPPPEKKTDKVRIKNKKKFHLGRGATRELLLKNNNAFLKKQDNSLAERRAQNLKKIQEMAYGWRVPSSLRHRVNSRDLEEDEELLQRDFFEDEELLEREYDDDFLVERDAFGDDDLD